MIVAGAGRPRPGEVVSGDAWAVQQHEGRFRLIVADGLGHGPLAAAAAEAALTTLAAHPDLCPVQALRLCHQNLQGGRGAVLALADLDPSAGRLVYAGVGNVEARLSSGGQQTRPISYRGIVGAAMPTVRPFEFPLAGDWLLVLHTDGVSARFDLSDPELPAEPAALADALLQRWARPRDDAAVLVARPAPAGQPPRPT